MQAMLECSKSLFDGVTCLLGETLGSIVVLGTPPTLISLTIYGLVHYCKSWDSFQSDTDDDIYEPPAEFVDVLFFNHLEEHIFLVDFCLLSF